MTEFIMQALGLFSAFLILTGLLVIALAVIAGAIDDRAGLR
jgi:hypothetical protein